MKPQNVELLAMIAELGPQMDALHLRARALEDQLACEVCDAQGDARIRPLMSSAGPVCGRCFMKWYENPEQLRLLP